MADDSLKVTRQMFDGKLNARVSLRKHTSYMITLRSGCFPVEECNLSGEIDEIEAPITSQPDYRKFVEYIEDLKSTLTNLLQTGRDTKERIAKVQRFFESYSEALSTESQSIIDKSSEPSRIATCTPLGQDSI